MADWFTFSVTPWLHLGYTWTIDWALTSACALLQSHWPGENRVSTSREITISIKEPS